MKGMGRMIRGWTPASHGLRLQGRWKRQLSRESPAAGSPAAVDTPRERVHVWRSICDGRLRLAAQAEIQEPKVSRWGSGLRPQYVGSRRGPGGPRPQARADRRPGAQQSCASWQAVCGPGGARAAKEGWELEESSPSQPGTGGAAGRPAGRRAALLLGREGHVGAKKERYDGYSGDES